MSPVGGVGINLAIQDAVATANILYRPLQKGSPVAADLAAVQKRRMFPTRFMQAVQVLVQERVLAPTLTGKQSTAVPLVLRLVNRFPILRRIPARIVGMGIRPEHVRSPEI
jgi:2-polyprenyl-6-methoxyphenol hydroxylase-like FAD-dependent oxidoreductase